MSPAEPVILPITMFCKPWLALVSFYKAKIVTVEPIVFLFMLGRFIYLLLCEHYYLQYFTLNILRNTSFAFPQGSFCINSSVLNNYTGNNNSYQNDMNFSDTLVLYGHLASMIPALVVTIILGPLTDRHGRKLGILFPSFGMIAQGILSIFIINYNLNPYYFLLVHFITGMTGGFTALIASCFTYTADISSLRWRTFRLAVVEGILSFGKVAGKLIGMYWDDEINCNLIPPMIFYIATAVLMVLYTIFLLPESFTRAERLELISKNTRGLIGRYIEGGKLFLGGLSLLSTWVLYVASSAINLAVINMEGAFLISVSFLKLTPFDFSAPQIDFYEALQSLSQGLCGLFGVLFFVALHIRDDWILLIGYVFNGLGNLLTGFASRTWQLYTSKMIFA